jgi:hypothetical protein
MTAVFIYVVIWLFVGFNGIVLSGAVVNVLVAPTAGNLYS